MEDSRALNLDSWDERAPAHAEAAEYAVDRFVADASFLSRVVRFDLPRLGDIAGQRGVHLQCHIGTDTISLSRLGAAMTGLDFSAAALTQARRLAERTGTDLPFVQADVYDAAAVLEPASFDLVYTGIGALCWLPDIARWARVVADLLRPGGRLFVREGHPMLWSLAGPRPDGLLVVDLPYFERPEPTVSTEGGTYVETDAVFTHNVTHEWSHGIGEIITALVNAGMALAAFTEHDSAPWEALPGQMTRDPNGEWRLADRPWRLPCTYTLQAVRGGG